jgi:ubiquinone/menaquinone biosynthesis C-methylase UbiE
MAVTGVDIFDTYVAYARARTGYPRLSFRTGDAVALDLPDGSYDRCYSLLALNSLPQALLAVQEMRRVTRPGGTIAAAVWDFAGGLTYQRIFWDTAALSALASAVETAYLAGLPDGPRSMTATAWAAKGTV